MKVYCTDLASVVLKLTNGWCLYQAGTYSLLRAILLQTDSCAVELLDSIGVHSETILLHQVDMAADDHTERKREQKAIKSIISRAVHEARQESTPIVAGYQWIDTVHFLVALSEEKGCLGASIPRECGVESDCLLSKSRQNRDCHRITYVHSREHKFRQLFRKLLTGPPAGRATELEVSSRSIWEGCSIEHCSGK